MSDDMYELYEIDYDYLAARLFALPSANGKGIDHMSDYDARLSQHRISGVFIKAFYELVKTKNWSVENAFKLFLRANIACLSPNLSLNDAATCLYDQAEFINPNNSVAQAKRDVDEVLHSVGLVAQSSGLSSLDLDINLLYNKITYRQSTLNKQDIAQIEIEWGDGEVETWSSTDNTAVQPYLEREKMLPVDKLAPFKITVTTTSGDVKVAYRHYYTHAVGVACKPYIENEQTTLTGSLSINDTAINIATQAYQQILDQAIEVQRGTSNTWLLGNTFDGQNATVLLDVNRDGIFF
jgi:hypothetical protein